MHTNNLKNPKYLFDSHSCSSCALFISRTLEILMKETLKFTHLCIYVLCISMQIVWAMYSVFGSHICYLFALFMAVTP